MMRMLLGSGARWVVFMWSHQDGHSCSGQHVTASMLSVLMHLCAGAHAQCFTYASECISPMGRPHESRRYSLWSPEKWWEACKTEAMTLLCCFLCVVLQAGMWTRSTTYCVWRLSAVPSSSAAAATGPTMFQEGDGAKKSVLCSRLGVCEWFCGVEG